MKYWISPLNTSKKIPDIFLTLLKIHQFFLYFANVFAKFLKFLIIPAKVATLWHLERQQKGIVNICYKKFFSVDHNLIIIQSSLLLKDFTQDIQPNTELLSAKSCLTLLVRTLLTFWWLAIWMPEICLDGKIGLWHERVPVLTILANSLPILTT